MATSRSPRIEIWLHEVLSASQPLSPTSPSPSTSQSPPQVTSPPSPTSTKRRSSLISKILKRPITGQGDGRGDFEKTEMYSVDCGGAETPARDGAGLNGGDGGDGEQEALAVASASVSKSGQEGVDRGLLARKERLERAARLLDRQNGKKG